MLHDFFLNCGITKLDQLQKLRGCCNEKSLNSVHNVIIDKLYTYVYNKYSGSKTVSTVCARCWRSRFRSTTLGSELLKIDPGLGVLDRVPEYIVIPYFEIR